MIHCNIVTFSIVIPFQINCKTHCNSFSCDDVLLKYHYYYYIMAKYTASTNKMHGRSYLIMKKIDLFWYKLVNNPGQQYIYIYIYI